MFTDGAPDEEGVAGIGVYIKRTEKKITGKKTVLWGFYFDTLILVSLKTKKGRKVLPKVQPNFDELSPLLFEVG